MKKVILLGAIIASTFSTMAQKLPAPSPSATIEQTVGLTDIKVTYSRPSAKGRKIFGELVEFDKVWRLGANACTKITTSTDVTFGKTTLKPGTYALFATPSESGKWTVVINSDIEQWGAGNYDPEKNLVSIEVDAKKSEFTETLTINFSNLTSNSGMISISWENLKVDVPFTLNTTKIAELNIAEAIKKGEDLTNVYYNAADYYFKVIKDNKKALSYANQSIELEKTHKNTFLKARIFKDLGKDDEALKTAKEANELALKADSKGWADYISSTIEKWSKK
jgi:uncharacterized protein (DUF2141 family)